MCGWGEADIQCCRDKTQKLTNEGFIKQAIQTMLQEVLEFAIEQVK